MKNGDITLLENVRFHAGEEKNNPELAKEFAQLADYSSMTHLGLHIVHMLRQRVLQSIFQR